MLSWPSQNKILWERCIIFRIGAHEHGSSGIVRINGRCNTPPKCAFAVEKGKQVERILQTRATMCALTLQPKCSDFDTFETSHISIKRSSPLGQAIDESEKKVDEHPKTPDKVGLDLAPHDQLHVETGQTRTAESSEKVLANFSLLCRDVSVQRKKNT